MNYHQIPAANPGTTAMTPVTRRQTIPINYPVATREDNKAVSKSYLERVFLLFHMGGVGCIVFVCFSCRYYSDFMQVNIQQSMFFFLTEIISFWYRLWITITAIGSVNITW